MAQETLNLTCGTGGKGSFPGHLAGCTSCHVHDEPTPQGSGVLGLDRHGLGVPEKLGSRDFGLETR